MSIIRTESLTYIYNPGTPAAKTALEDFSMSVEEGAFLGIIGHTGSGKSTLIQQLNGLLKPAKGRVFIDGKDIWENKSKLKELRLEVGLVFQYPEYQLFEETVYKDIAFGPKNMGVSGRELDEVVRAAAESVGIGEELLNKSPFELSGGQKRRAALAGALAMRPRVLILDEPAAGLDPAGRKSILGKIKEYHKKQGNTVLLVSHSMEDIAEYATRAIVLNKGRLYMQGEIDEVFGNSAKLAEIGLSLPQITRIFGSLIKEGFELKSNVYSHSDAADEIMRYIRQKGGVKNA